MKILYLIILLSFNSYAHDSQKIKELEERIKILEGQTSTAENSQGLKVQDLKNKKMGTQHSTSKSSGITKKIKEEFLDKIKEYKKSRDAQQKYLDELDREDP
jgi:uncharacterized protein YdaU (DUF1376 family)